MRFPRLRSAAGVIPATPAAARRIAAAARARLGASGTLGRLRPAAVTAFAGAARAGGAATGTRGGFRVRAPRERPAAHEGDQGQRTQPGQPLTTNHFPSPQCEMPRSRWPATCGVATAFQLFIVRYTFMALHGADCHPGPPLAAKGAFGGGCRRAMTGLVEGRTPGLRAYVHRASTPMRREGVSKEEVRREEAERPFQAVPRGRDPGDRRCRREGVARPLRGGAGAQVGAVVHRATVLLRFRGHGLVRTALASGGDASGPRVCEAERGHRPALGRS